MRNRERRRVRYKKKEKKEVPKEKHEKGLPGTKKVAIVVGRAYTLEELQTLIASLASESTEKQVYAVAEFAENQGAVAEAAANTAEVSGTDIVELVIAAVLKNQQQMLTTFEKEKKVKALSFVAKSSSIPLAVQKKAAAVLARIQPPAAEKPVKKEEPTLVKIPYTPKQVQTLVKNLESKVKEIRIPAAIQFIRDYPRIAPAVSKIPMLTVTSVTTKALAVIKNNTEQVLNIMVKKKMLPALLFLASLAQAPLPLRKRAEQAAEKLRVEMPVVAMEKAPPVLEKAPIAEKKEEKVEELKLEPVGKRSKDYLPLELEALLDSFTSVEHVRSVKAAAEFLRNYDLITKLISKTPMLTVTEVTTKAVKVIEANVDAVIKELKSTKDIHAIQFLAQSSEFSMKTRKRAAYVLKQMMKPFKDD